MYFLQIYFKSSTPTHKALSAIVGIGKGAAIQTCDQLGISPRIALKDLLPFQIAQFSQIVHQNILVNDEYRTFVREKIKRLTLISCYRGFRHLEGLPCRGQRTHTNARTSKKKILQSGSSKKKS